MAPKRFPVLPDITDDNSSKQAPKIHQRSFANLTNNSSFLLANATYSEQESDDLLNWIDGLKLRASSLFDAQRAELAQLRKDAQQEELRRKHRERIDLTTFDKLGQFLEAKEQGNKNPKRQQVAGKYPRSHMLDSTSKSDNMYSDSSYPVEACDDSDDDEHKNFEDSESEDILEDNESLVSNSNSYDGRRGYDDHDDDHDDDVIEILSDDSITIERHSDAYDVFNEQENEEEEEDEEEGELLVLQDLQEFDDESEDDDDDDDDKIDKADGDHQDQLFSPDTRTRSFPQQSVQTSSIRYTNGRRRLSDFSGTPMHPLFQLQSGGKDTDDLVASQDNSNVDHDRENAQGRFQNESDDRKTENEISGDGFDDYVQYTQHSFDENELADPNGVISDYALVAAHFQELEDDSIHPTTNLFEENNSEFQECAERALQNSNTRAVLETANEPTVYEKKSEATNEPKNYDKESEAIHEKRVSSDSEDGDTSFYDITNVDLNPNFQENLSGFEKASSHAQSLSLPAECDAANLTQSNLKVDAYEDLELEEFFSQIQDDETLSNSSATLASQNVSDMGATDALPNEEVSTASNETCKVSMKEDLEMTLDENRELKEDLDIAPESFHEDPICGDDQISLTPSISNIISQISSNRAQKKALEENNQPTQLIPESTSRSLTFKTIEQEDTRTILKQLKAMERKFNIKLDAVEQLTNEVGEVLESDSNIQLLPVPLNLSMNSSNAERGTLAPEVYLELSIEAPGKKLANDHEAQRFGQSKLSHDLLEKPEKPILENADPMTEKPAVPILEELDDDDIQSEESSGSSSESDQLPFNGNISSQVVVVEPATEEKILVIFDEFTEVVSSEVLAPSEIEEPTIESPDAQFTHPALDFVAESDEDTSIVPTEIIEPIDWTQSSVVETFEEALEFAIPTSIEELESMRNTPLSIEKESCELESNTGAETNATFRNTKTNMFDSEIKNINTTSPSELRKLKPNRNVLLDMELYQSDSDDTLTGFKEENQTHQVNPASQKCNIPNDKGKPHISRSEENLEDLESYKKIDDYQVSDSEFSDALTKETDKNAEETQEGKVKNNYIKGFFRKRKLKDQESSSSPIKRLKRAFFKSNPFSWYRRDETKEPLGNSENNSETKSKDNSSENSGADFDKSGICPVEIGSASMLPSNTNQLGDDFDYVTQHSPSNSISAESSNSEKIEDLLQFLVSTNSLGIKTNGKNENHISILEGNDSDGTLKSSQSITNVPETPERISQRICQHRRRPEFSKSDAVSIPLRRKNNRDTSSFGDASIFEQNDDVSTAQNLEKCRDIDNQNSIHNEDGVAMSVPSLPTSESYKQIAQANKVEMESDSNNLSDCSSQSNEVSRNISQTTERILELTHPASDNIKYIDEAVQTLVDGGEETQNANAGTNNLTSRVADMEIGIDHGETLDAEERISKNPLNAVQSDAQQAIQEKIDTVYEQGFGDNKKFESEDRMYDVRPVSVDPTQSIADAPEPEPESNFSQKEDSPEIQLSLEGYRPVFRVIPPLTENLMDPTSKVEKKLQDNTNKRPTDNFPFEEAGENPVFKDQASPSSHEKPDDNKNPSWTMNEDPQELGTRQIPPDTHHPDAPKDLKSHLLENVDQKLRQEETEKHNEINFNDVGEGIVSDCQHQPGTVTDNFGLKDFEMSPTNASCDVESAGSSTSISNHPMTQSGTRNSSEVINSTKTWLDASSAAELQNTPHKPRMSSVADVCTTPKTSEVLQVQQPTPKVPESLAPVTRVLRSHDHQQETPQTLGTDENLDTHDSLKTAGISDLRSEPSALDDSTHSESRSKRQAEDKSRHASSTLSTGILPRESSSETITKKQENILAATSETEPLQKTDASLKKSDTLKASESDHLGLARAATEQKKEDTEAPPSRMKAPGVNKTESKEFDTEDHDRVGLRRSRRRSQTVSKENAEHKMTDIALGSGTQTLASGNETKPSKKGSLGKLEANASAQNTDEQSVRKSVRNKLKQKTKNPRKPSTKTKNPKETLDGVQKPTGKGAFSRKPRAKEPNQPKGTQTPKRQKSSEPEPKELLKTPDKHLKVKETMSEDHPSLRTRSKSPIKRSIQELSTEIDAGPSKKKRNVKRKNSKKNTTEAMKEQDKRGRPRHR